MASLLYFAANFADLNQDQLTGWLVCGGVEVGDGTIKDVQNESLARRIDLYFLLFSIFYSSRFFPTRGYFDDRNARRQNPVIF